MLKVREGIYVYQGILYIAVKDNYYYSPWHYLKELRGKAIRFAWDEWVEYSAVISKDLTEW